MARSSRLFRRILRWYPLSPGGSLLLLLLLYLAGYGFARENLLFVIFSLSGIVIMLLIGLGAWLQIRRPSQGLVWEIAAMPVASDRLNRLPLRLGEPKPWPFYRRWGVLDGSLKAGPRFSLRYHQTVIESPDTAGWMEFRLRSLYTGILEAGGSLYLGDCFGLVRFQADELPPLYLPVVPSMADRTSNETRSRSEGSASERQKNDTDPERYYMREYVAGDRFRDINWKASSRIKKLITRIPPDTSKTTELYTLVLWTGGENYGRDQLLVSFLKSVMTGFITRMQEEKKSRQFRIIAGSEEFLLEKEDERDGFRKWLASVPQSQPTPENLPQSIIVFALNDRNYQRWLLPYAEIDVTTILVAPSEEDKADIRLLASDLGNRYLIPPPAVLKCPKKERFFVPAAEPTVREVVRISFPLNGKTVSPGRSQ